MPIPGYSTETSQPDFLQYSGFSQLAYSAFLIPPYDYQAAYNRALSTGWVLDAWLSPYQYTNSYNQKNPYGADFTSSAPSVPTNQTANLIMADYPSTYPYSSDYPYSQTPAVAPQFMIVGPASGPTPQQNNTTLIDFTGFSLPDYFGYVIPPDTYSVAYNMALGTGAATDGYLTPEDYKAAYTSNHPGSTPPAQSGTTSGIGLAAAAALALAVLGGK